MNSRERVLAAIAGEKPDRTPRDFWAEKAALNRILEDAGHRDEERLLEELGIDLRHLNAVEPREREIRPGLFQNHWGERFVYRQTPWGPLREDTKGALSGARSTGDIEAFPWPSPDDFDRSGLAEACRRHGDKAIVYGFADVWERPALARGWEEWFADLVERPEWAHRLARIFTDFYKEDYARAAEATGSRIDLYFLITDLAGQRGPIISPAMFREFVEPYLKEMIDHIHELGGLVLYHSCGCVARLIPDLIRLGIDVLDPIQPAGPEMAPERLAADFGGRLTFHGGIDMQRLLPLGTPGEVRAEARRYREALGSRYIIAPAHFFLPDIPPANVRAVYE